MGSEHYCLRWNNHQSNLLGVFSQLLQDESLVDVTLSCSEGAPIRAHKVVLSACSSYFQSLFLDHPERHPIVILKDVRFAELQTLVEFMYKGEVNVQYCQLSALLKTAESLKVKGLAEMTNQNTTLREPEREPDRLRSHSQPGKKTCESPVDAALAGSAPSSASSSTSASSIVASTATISATSAASLAVAATSTAASSSSSSGVASSTHPSATATTTNTTTTSSGATASDRSSSNNNAASALPTTTTSALKRDASERCSPSPPKRLLATTSHAATAASSPVPLDLYQRRPDHATDGSESTRSHATDNTPSTSNNQANRCKTPATAADLSTATNSNNNGDERDFHSPERMERPPSISLHRGSSGGGGSGAGDIEEIEDVDDDYDEEMDDDDDADNSSNDMGLHLKNIAAMVAANAAAAAGHGSTAARTPLVLPHSPLSAGGGGDVESARSTPAGVPATATSTALPADLTQRPASRSSRDGGGASSAHCSLDRPSSRGGVGGGDGGGRYALPSAHGGDLSPNSLAASGATGVGDSSGLGPVQSVPLSLKKEIDCSEDDNSSSRHMLLQPRSASAGGGLGGGGGGVAELDYRASHESLLHNFGHSMVGMGATGIPPASLAARCPAPPFAFPFTPLGLSLFDIDPSRILSMLHHQTWLAEEALRSRGLLAAPKESPHRFATLSDLLSKEYQALPHGPHLPAGDLHATAAITAKQQQQTHRSNSQQQMYKHQQQHQPFNIRYPSPAATAAAAFFHHQQQQQHQQHQHHQHQQQQQEQHHHHHQQQNEQQKAKQSRQGQTPSPLQTATSTQPSWSPKDPLLEELKRKSEETVQREECEAEGSSIITNELLSSNHDDNGASLIVRSSNSNTPTSSSLYKDSLEQLLQRRHSSSSLGEGMRSATSYSQLLLSASCSTIETSSCKEKSSSSSTSSTPPLTLAPKTANTTTTTAALLAQHQHQQQQQQHQLNHMLKSPSAESSSSLFSETIEEETRCIVCNAHFPNVWLLEQHAALQHPHLGPGEEKPFICEQCGQSYRYRSAYAKHKEQNHRARLPADKLFTCDVCGMQFRYLKSFKKHRLNHALERLHGKKIGPGGLGTTRMHMTSAGIGVGHMEQDVVTSSQEPNLPVADESGEDLRINIKREPFDEEREEEQDNTIDSVGGGGGGSGGVSSGSSSLLLFNDNNSTASTSTEPNISSSDVIHSTNKRPRLLTTPLMETDPSYHHHHLQHHHPHLAPSHVHVAAPSSLHPSHQQPTASTAAAAAAALNSLHSINSITSLINAERIPSEQFLGLNPQEASILNFLRVDAAERQRDKRGPQTSRFACPFCGKCVRSKENLKLHVRKHTGERPFVCLFCGRAFGGKSDLTRHLRIHTGERPYHCESCGKCFARADYLSKHLTTHIHNAPR